MPSSTDVAREVRVPRETVNDDFVVIQSWAAAHGARVDRGQVVAHIETSKAVLEIEAEAAGFLHHLHPSGFRAPVGELIGRIEEAAPTASNASEGIGASAQPPIEGVPAPESANGDVTISRKARELIAEHGVDPAVFAGRGLVRERDVRAHLEQAAGPAPAAPVPERPRQGASVQATGGYARKGLFGDAAASAGNRGRSLPWLIWNYFWRNWLLGNLVRLAPRGVINVLHRWRGVKMGRDCFIDPTAILETAYPENITMGDDVRITVGCIIMTHIGPPHHLRDTGIMPAQIRAVRLEDHCFIGVNAVIMPGVTVGRGAVVASGAVVTTNVPAYTMVSGNPARIVRRFSVPGAAAGEEN